MGKDRFPNPGEIYIHFKGKPYQIITVATNTETGELMVVYQAMYGDFKTYVRNVEMFLSEVDHTKYPEVKQKYRFELKATREPELKSMNTSDTTSSACAQSSADNGQSILEKEQPVAEGSLAPVTTDGVNTVLLKFLDAQSFSKKLEVITTNRKYLNDRLINDMAVSLDCAVEEGPLETRIQGLIYCLEAMCRFEDRRLR